MRALVATPLHKVVEGSLTRDARARKL
jgi:hypothetical protein